MGASCWFVPDRLAAREERAASGAALTSLLQTFETEMLAEEENFRCRRIDACKGSSEERPVPLFWAYEMAIEAEVG
jgi:hypothetical protein